MAENAGANCHGEVDEGIGGVKNGGQVYGWAEGSFMEKSMQTSGMTRMWLRRGEADGKQGEKQEGLN